MLGASALAWGSRDAIGTQTTSTVRLPVLLALLVLAALIRLLCFNGLIGSDDDVYLTQALNVALGDWTVVDYNGALRYGFNLPAGLFVWLFGPTVFAVNLWPLLCSILEVGVVIVLGAAMAGRRVGVLAGLVLASAPLHVAVATRVHADPVVALFVTLSFALLWAGLQRQQPGLLLAAGLSIGSIFWAKELAVLTWFAFLPLLWLFRSRWRLVVPVIGGVVIMLALSGVLMWVLTGDPLHAIKVVLGQVSRAAGSGERREESPAYYLRYLFLDLRHIGLLAYLALPVAMVAAARPRDRLRRVDLAWLTTWLLGLIALLSLFPVSLFPLRLVMRQSNYISLFLAPLALFAALALDALPRRLGRLLLGVSMVLGMSLALLQQADYRAFGANSKAVGVWAAAHPGAVVVGSVNNASLGVTWAELLDPEDTSATVLSFRDLDDDSQADRSEAAAAGNLFAVLDRQTAGWKGGARPVIQPLLCWSHVQRLEPIDLGLGNALADHLSRAADKLAKFGVTPAGMVRDVLARLAQPESADLYKVSGADPLCGTP